MLSAGGPAAAAVRGAGLGGGRNLPVPLPVTASHGDSSADAAPVRLGLGLRAGQRSGGMVGPFSRRGGVVAAAARGSASASSARSRSRGRSRKDGGGGADGGDGGDGVGGNGGSADNDSTEPGGEGEGEGGGEGGGQGSVEDRELYDEAYDSYMGYALSVIVSRALPDARDGLKPVHRRILYAMHELGLTHTKPFKKCARVVGEVLGKFHPHGDTAVYDALVRMAQPFSMGMPLIQGHGNFGSQDADPAAAMRYTECRLAPLATDALLADLGGTWPRRGATVDWIKTFDESQEEPSVLPAAVPLLLVNGSSGIAVGLASSIPPHNMAEVVAALRHLIHHPEASTEELMAFVQGPDFPTGGELVVGPELQQAYDSGRGQVTLRAKAAVEVRAGKGGDRERIVITELPYQVAKADLISTIAAMVTDKERCRELGLEGVADVRDESDRSGLKVVVELRRGAGAEDTLARLFKHTRLQTRVSFNCVAMVGAMPHHMGLRAMLQTFLDFRCEVVRRRSEHALAAAQSRLHLVEGFLGLLQDPGRMDAVVAEVRGAPDGAAAKAALVERHGLSMEQAAAVLSLTLGRLTHLEASKLVREAEQLAVSISGHQAVLSDRAELLRVVEEAAAALVQDYPTPRRTVVLRAEEGSSPSSAALPPAARAPNRPCLLLATSSGFLRRLPEDGVRAQNRATKGKTGIKVRGEAGLAGLVACREQDPLLLLTPGGHAYETRAADVQAQVSGSSTGSSIAQVLKLEASVPISAMLPLPPRGAQQQQQQGEGEEEEEGEGGAHEDCPSIVLCSTAGHIKRIQLPATRINKKGIKVMDLGPKAAAGGAQSESESGPGSLGWAALAGCGGDVVVLASRQGQLLALRAGDVRVQGRAARGVKAMALGGKRRPGDAIADVAVVPRRLAHLMPARGAAGAADEAEAEHEEEHGQEGGQGPEAAVTEPTGPCLLLISEAGYGKRVRLQEVALARRAQAGQRGAALRPGDRLVGCLVVEAGDEVVLASTRGAVVRMAAEAVSLQGRGARGVKLMGLEPGDSVADVVLAPRGGEGEGEGGEGEGGKEEEAAKGKGKRSAAVKPKGKGKKGADAA